MSNIQLPSNLVSQIQSEQSSTVFSPTNSSVTELRISVEELKKIVKGAVNEAVKNIQIKSHQESMFADVIQGKESCPQIDWKVSWNYL
jgi:hypothetical protein